MSKADVIFKKTLMRILDEGVTDNNYNVRPHWEDGTPAHTQYVTQVMHEYNLQEEFPAITVRPTAMLTGAKESLWIYQDQSNDVGLLEEKYGVKYWKSWANEQNNLGKAYGKQMSYKHEYSEGMFNQVDYLIHTLKTDPMNRGLITNLYNHSELSLMTLRPCAFMTMWSVEEDRLNMTLVQRSSDYVVANNINATQYAIFQHMIAQITGFKAGKLTHFMQNVHVYDRHRDFAKELLTRDPRKAPKFTMDADVKNFYDFRPEHFKFEDYEPHPQKKLEVAI